MNRINSRNFALQIQTEKFDGWSNIISKQPLGQNIKHEGLGNAALKDLVERNPKYIILGGHDRELSSILRMVSRHNRTDDEENA